MRSPVRQEPPSEPLTLPGGEIDELVDAAWRARQADRQLADELGHATPSGAQANAHYLSGLGEGAALPRRTEQKLLLAARAGDQAARAQLVEAFLAHIAGVARVYRQ